MHWKKFLEPTCWAIWGLVVGGAAFWVVVGSVGYFSRSGWLTNDSSGWVQALGSIAAIAAAFHIGNIQHKRQLAENIKVTELKRTETRMTMWRLSMQTAFQLTSLQSALGKSFTDHGDPSLRSYLLEGHDLRLIHLMEALQAIDVRDLTGIQTMLLMDIKVGCSFAIRTCEGLSSWCSFGDQERLVVSQVNYHRARAQKAVEMSAPQVT